MGELGSRFVLDELRFLLKHWDLMDESLDKSGNISKVYKQSLRNSANCQCQRGRASLTQSKKLVKEAEMDESKSLTAFNTIARVVLRSRNRRQLSVRRRNVVELIAHVTTLQSCSTHWNLVENDSVCKRLRAKRL